MLKMITINVQGDTDTEGIQIPTAQIQKKKKKKKALIPGGTLFSFLERTQRKMLRHF